MSVFSDCLIICFLLNMILGASSSEFHSISSTSESSQKQEELKKQKQKTKIVETEKVKGENKINPLSLKISSVILLTVCHTGRVTLVWGIWYWINLLSPY